MEALEISTSAHKVGDMFGKDHYRNSDPWSLFQYWLKENLKAERERLRGCKI